MFSYTSDNGHSLEAISHLASQEIPRHLRKPKFITEFTRARY